MKDLHKVLALLLGSVMAVSLFAGCGETGGNNTGDNGGSQSGDTGNQGDDKGDGGTTEGDPAAFARICYDNLPDDGIEVPAHETKVVIKGATKIESASAGVKVEDIISYDSATGVFSGVGAGTVSYTGADGKKARIEVVPAYVTNPGTQYSGKIGDDTSEDKGQELLGYTHDPSFIEYRAVEGGAVTYYLFSTGWAYQSSVKVSGKTIKTYGNAIHSSRDLLSWKFEGRTFDVSTRDEDFINREAGKWLYDGTLSQNDTKNPYSKSSASWWAPDIVACPSGGYWLYTCVVDGSSNSDGMMIDGKLYARACILLYHADKLTAGSFKPVLFPEGHPDAGKQVVLMQSSIERGETEKDVNGIDPQIIYSPDGKMYMAYGSFGSGNYIIELDPETGMRKDGKGWQSHEQIRGYIKNNIQDLYNNYKNSAADNKPVGWTHDYYGTNISKANMEAPVIARHDNVKISDETDEYDANGEPVGVEGKTYYYSMHSYDGLNDNYQMWGGRSESVTGVYRSVMGGMVYNADDGFPAHNQPTNEGNKYMGAFKWATKEEGVTEYDIMLTGHNDLITTKFGVSLAAYITRISSTPSADNNFVTQIHQYYLNSLGHIVINPNRFGGEIDREVTKDELFKYTQKDASNNYKFKMVVMANHRDTQAIGDAKDFSKINNVSVDVTLTENGKLLDNAGTELGDWVMYGKGYIKFAFKSAPMTNPAGTGTNARMSSGDTVYYGVVRPAWLGDQNKSGFTITCLGATEGNSMSMPLFFNNYSAMTGSDLVG